MLAVAQTNAEYKSVKTLMDWVFTIVGAVFISWSLYQAAIHLGTFATTNTLKDFALPPLLTLAFLLFLYIMALFVTYDDLFKRLPFFIKDDKLVRFAKARTLFAFNVRLTLLNKWSHPINQHRLESRKDVLEAIRGFPKKAVEGFPPRPKTFPCNSPPAISILYPPSCDVPFAQGVQLTRALGRGAWGVSFSSYPST